jgi:hypothetical protein
MNNYQKNKELLLSYSQEFSSLDFKKVSPKYWPSPTGHALILIASLIGRESIEEKVFNEDQTYILSKSNTIVLLTNANQNQIKELAMCGMKIDENERLFYFN